VVAALVPAVTPPPQPAATVSPAAPAWIADALRDAGECLEKRKYDCAIAKAGEVLQAEAGNPVAQRVLAQARGQQDALKGDWKMR
jgi:hypothetical protein